MPVPKPTSELPSDEHILAATARAERHNRHDGPGELLRTIKDHLELPHNAWTTRQLRPKLEALEAAGLIEQIHRHGIVLFGLTTKGRRRAKSIACQVTLPESPQHRRWLEATTAAAERISDLRAEVGKSLSDAGALLETAPDTSSEAWFDLSERLQDACWNLAAATYCLSEWPEPSDLEPDIDDAPSRMRGRRLTGRWDRR
jgi:hypothetical protein